MTSQGSPSAGSSAPCVPTTSTSSGVQRPELPRVDLGDALTVCVAIRDAEPERLERAALRWLARFAAEQAQTVADVREAAGAMAVMASDPTGALDVLRRLCNGRA